MPARAPPSIDMLQTVMRPSIERARIADPAYSMTCPAAPATPMGPIVPRIRSLAPTPTPASPSMLTRIVRGLACGRVWVARTCSTSLVPMPKASAPKAPCVEVWLSPQTIVMPGWVTPELGADDVDDALARAAQREERDAELGAVALEGLDLGRARAGRRCRASRPMVGTLWSTVASVRSGRRTVRPASRRPSKACGEVTSWTRCRST